MVFHIPSRPTAHPYHLDGAYLMRSGESLVAMSADQLQKIFGERPSGRPTAAYIISALILGLVILIAMKYWPSHNPRQHDPEIKSVETDTSRNKTDATGHQQIGVGDRSARSVNKRGRTERKSPWPQSWQFLVDGSDRARRCRRLHAKATSKRLLSWNSSRRLPVGRGVREAGETLRNGNFSVVLARVLMFCGSKV